MNDLTNSLDCLEWAKKRYLELKQALQDFTSNDVLETRLETTPPEHIPAGLPPGARCCDSYAKLLEPIPREVHHLTREVVGALRAALNYAVVAVAEDPPFPKRLQFVVCSRGRKDFREQAIRQHRLAGVPCEVIKIIERYQPYREKRGPQHDALYWLVEVDDASKHRRIVAPGLSNAEAKIGSLHIDGPDEELRLLLDEQKMNAADVLGYEALPVPMVYLDHQEFRLIGRSILRPILPIERVAMAIRFTPMLRIDNWSAPLQKMLPTLISRVTTVLNEIRHC